MGRAGKGSGLAKDHTSLLYNALVDGLVYCALPKITSIHNYAQFRGMGR